MKVTLKHYTPLEVCSMAIRTCWQSFDKSDGGGEKDLSLIDRVGNKNKHSSTLEHLYYNFYIQGISRACLQELARHRMASYSVKSSRYTLKEIKEEPSFLPINEENQKRAEKYIVFTSNENVNIASISALENLRKLLLEPIGNDLAKYAMPECYKTELHWSINARSLQNFLELRTNRAALWEIQKLAHSIYNALPQEHKFIFEEKITQPYEKN
ncbi:FAD-dependent thymidylate synthase [Helicobacter cappadocius]|uniref:Flavin-dependent thymidylate synthase n=1 Tax=Helicobacter cappadocius TaxID=3063998 RepID=A0AA90PJ86_9HELI|nr:MULTISPECIES: FAD-dependent thymidylate synthase [unclassified Helicobacter]MDO7252342.1 FAD-dependent thymidylate synthase [Helicobacter sp. faydin-H75]MDP2538209.1 FAD-dependent thymidylate synthase [Helicobacter sp. faydin-H76]